MPTWVAPSQEDGQTSEIGCLPDGSGLEPWFDPSPACQLHGLILTLSLQAHSQCLDVPNTLWSAYLLVLPLSS